MIRFLPLGVVALAMPLWCGPAIQFAGNSASYAPYGMPNWGIAQGSMFTVFGSGLGPATPAQALSFPLPLNLGGSSVSVNSGSGTTSAYVLYASDSQVTAILPSNTPMGSGTVSVSYNGQTSAGSRIYVVAKTFGIFTLNEAGSGPAVAQNFIDQDHQPFNTLLATAHPGQTMRIYGTGLGAVSGSEANQPLPGDLSDGVQLFVGPVQAQILYAGRSGCCSGLDQIDFIVPDGIEGCYVPIAVLLSAGLNLKDFGQSNAVSNFATISIDSTGGGCSDPSGLSGAELAAFQQKGQIRAAAIQLNSGFTTADIRANPTSHDTGSARFAGYSLPQLLYSKGIYGMPALGTCVSGTIPGPALAFPDPEPFAPLDAGAAIHVSGRGGAQQINRQADGSYAGDFGTGYLTPGMYALHNGAGGADVGAFQATLNVPAPLTFKPTNVTSRTNPLRITWTGGGADSYALIGGIGSNGAVDWFFVCTEDSTVGSFVTPRVEVFDRAVAETPDFPSLPGLILYGTASRASRLTAPGLDVGFAASFFWGALFSP